MLVNRLYDLLCFQFMQCLPGQTAVDLQALDEHTDTHESIGPDLFEQLVVRWFVEEDGIVSLVLDLAL